jgi:hypothetical protein
MGSGGVGKKSSLKPYHLSKARINKKQRQMSKLSPLEIVKGFQKSVATGSDDWNSIVSDQIVFKGPVDQVSGKDRFIQLNRGFFPLVQEYKPVNAFEGASSVCLEGIFKVKTPKGNVIE